MAGRDKAPDVITARALAPLSRLLEWTEPAWRANGQITLILPKGRNVSRETSAAETLFSFEHCLHDSAVDPESCVLIVRNIAHK